MDVFGLSWMYNPIQPIEYHSNILYGNLISFGIPMVDCTDTVPCDVIDDDIEEVIATNGDCTCPFCSGRFKVVVREEAPVKNTVHCKRCGFDWTTRKDTPLKCPRCGSYSWNKETKKCTCLVCGHEWIRRKDGDNPTRCPSCNSSRWNEPPTVMDKFITAENPTAVRNRWILDRYKDGDGCLAIASELGLPLLRVIKVVKDSLSMKIMPRI